MTYEYYGKIGLPRLFSDNISLSFNTEGVVYLKGYFPYEFSIVVFLIAANLYFLESLHMILY